MFGPAKTASKPKPVVVVAKSPSTMAATSSPGPKKSPTQAGSFSSAASTTSSSSSSSSSTSSSSLGSSRTLTKTSRTNISNIRRPIAGGKGTGGANSSPGATANSATGAAAAAAAAAKTTTLLSNKASNSKTQLAGSLTSGIKSTSRSSLLSDTTASVCSFTSSRSAAPTTTTTALQLQQQRRQSSSSLINNSPLGLTRRSSSLLSSASGAGQIRQHQSTTVSKPCTSTSSSSKPGTLIKTTKTSGQLTVSSLSRSRPAGATNSSASPTSTAAAAATVATTTTCGGQKHRVPTLAMSLRDKDQQIKLLIKERDEQKCRAELMAKKVDEWREKFEASELERSHVTSEADDEVVELRRLAQEFEDENKRLAARLTDREAFISDAQFKLDELDCERQELRRQLEEKEDQLAETERERRQLLESANGDSGGGGGGGGGGGDVQAQQVLLTERVQSKVKYERELEELRERLLGKEEQMMQLRSSLEMRKNEVVNLQAHSADLERKLKIESERSERHLKRIDEINLELKAAEAKLSTKLEENDVLDRQVRQLRQELRSAEDKLEQLSLARKKDVDILHQKLSAARRTGSTTPTSSPQPGGGGSYKTPTPQDEMVRLQMELRDLKDQLIDREAELDCNRRDLEVMRRKMETRTLEVDCNNQELARRCQDLLEQNRQSEDTIKQLLKSTTDHSAQLMRATEDLKEANGKCVRLREEVNELEVRLDEQLKRSGQLARENNQLKESNDELEDQIEILRQQVESLNEQLGDLCRQLDAQTSGLHKDRELMADQLSRQDIELAQLRHDLAGAKQDLRTSKLQTQEVASERERLKADLDIKDKYIRSRSDLIETMRDELDDSRRSLAELKSKLEALRESSEEELRSSGRELKSQMDSLRRELQAKCDECHLLRQECLQLQGRLEELRQQEELASDEKFDEMRRKHSEELDELKLRLRALEGQLVEASNNNNNNHHHQNDAKDEVSKQRRDEYETQIEFLNSLVVDMQRKCDDYKSRMAQMNIVNQFDQLILAPLVQHQGAAKQPGKPIIASANGGANRAATLSRTPANQQQRHQMTSDFATLTRPRGVVRVQDPLSKGGEPPMGDQQVAANQEGEAPRKVSFQRQRQQYQQAATRISGRPYCDNCQVYDLHHTVHCNRQPLIEDGNNNSNNNNNNININEPPLTIGANSTYVDELFREYEQSIQEELNRSQFSSLRKPTPKPEQQHQKQTITANNNNNNNNNNNQPDQTLRPYCDHCDLFGHTVKSCQSLVQA